MRKDITVEVPFQNIYGDIYRNNVAQQFEQVDAGLYSLKRYGYYLQKMCVHRKPTLQDLLKDTEHESGKKDRIEVDRMANHVRAYRHMQDIQFNMLTNELKLVIDILESVADPLLTWHKIAEKRRDNLVKQDEKQQKDVKDQHAKIAKMRKECMVQWNAMQTIQKEYSKIDSYLKESVGVPKPKFSIKDLQNVEKKLEKERSKAIQQFAQFEQFVQASNGVLEHYWNVDLPALLSELEMLETERLQMLGSHMLQYSILMRRSVGYTDAAAESLFSDVRGLNAKGEMQIMASSISSMVGIPEGPIVVTYQLPCNTSMLGSQDPMELLHLLARDTNAATQEIEPAQERIGTKLINPENPLLQTFLQGFEDNLPTQPNIATSNNDSVPLTYNNALSIAPGVLQPQASMDVVSTTVSHQSIQNTQDEQYVLLEQKQKVPPTPEDSLPTDTIVQDESIHTITAATKDNLGVAPIKVPVGTIVIAAGEYDFEGTGDVEDMPFLEGEAIAVLQQPAESEWWIGARFDVYTGAVLSKGAFPLNYVSILDIPFQEMTE